MNKNIAIVAVLLGAWFMTSCVASKKYVDAKLQISSLRADSARLANNLKSSRTSNTELNHQLDSLRKRLNMIVDAAKDEITNQKEALANKEKQISDSEKRIQEQQARLSELEAIIQKQREISSRLQKSISDALLGFNSDELNVSVKNGKVYVSLLEKLLFKSGSAVVDPRGKEALSKVAHVLNQNPSIEINIEGHTDSIPIRGKYQDNWALSVARSTSVVRILTQDYHVDPKRVEASGHSEFDPVDTNSTPEGRAHNRRTDIVLSPNLDELYKLINEGSDN